MKVSDFIYRFPAHWGLRLDGICRVRVFVNTKSDVYVILTELGYNNPSVYVENAFDTISRSLIYKGYIPSTSKFIIHEEKERHSNESFRIIETSDQYCERYISKQSIIEIIDCLEDEFILNTLQNPTLKSEIFRIRNEINPYQDFPFPEDYKVTKRRMAITDNMIGKEKILELINDNVKEQYISDMLKKDLSIIAETYAFPQDEYICFSEFPLDDKFIDFVLFTGRSKMTIILIEIKGADFYLSKKNHYGNFNNKIEEAAQQLRNHDRFISNNYFEVRKHMHDVRLQVEKGKKLYNSLLCPKGHLQVDPDKDITIRKVILAGRTRDDLGDSRKRGDYERENGIHIESWDSWINKLRR